MILGVINQKGGVGKTTTVTNLAGALALAGKTVLIVDADPQANSTNALGFDDEQLDKTLYNLMADGITSESEIMETVRPTAYDGVSVLPCTIDLADAEISLSGKMSREHILSRILRKIESHFDYILVDCPPSLGLLSVNGLVASDKLIIPVSPGFFSVKGIRHLMGTIDLVRENLRPELVIMGVLITRFDKRKNLAKDVRDVLVDVFGDKVFKTVIRENVQIEYAQDNQVPVVYYNRDCNGSIDYMELSQEVLAHGQ